MKCKWDISNIFIQVCFSYGFIKAKYLEPSCLYYSKLCNVSLNSKEIEVIELSNVIKMMMMIMMMMLITIVAIYIALLDIFTVFGLCGKGPVKN